MRDRLLGQRNTIYGFCALWIVLFHIYKKLSIPTVPVVSHFLSIGNLSVDLFFFLSGLCLSLSAKKHRYSENGWKPFFQRRLRRILLPYLLVGLPYYFWYAICEGSGSLLHRALWFLANVSSASFWLKGLQTTWYVYGILLFYLLFPLLYRFARKSTSIQKIILLLVFYGAAVLFSNLPILRNSAIVWARLPIFTIGVFFGDRENDCRKAPISLCILAAGIFSALGYLTSFRFFSVEENSLFVYKWLLFAPMTLSALFLLSAFGKRIRFLEWIGGLSLEIYLTHITALALLEHFDLIRRFGAWLYLLLPVYAVLTAWAVRLLTRRIRSRLEG